MTDRDRTDDTDAADAADAARERQDADPTYAEPTAEPTVEQASDPVAPGPQDIAADPPPRSDDRPADIPDDLREPAGADLVPAGATSSTAAEGEESLAWPGEDDEADAVVKTYPPKRSAIISLGVLAAILLALAGIGFAQDGVALQKSLVPGQMQGMAQFLTQEKVQSFTTAERTKLGEAWADRGVNINPTAEQFSDTISATYPDKAVTAKQINDALKKKKVTITALRLQTVEQIDSSLRTQSLIFLAVGLIAAASAFFYARGAKWGRTIGLVVSGLVVVLYLLQLLNGALSLPVIFILLVGAVSFFFLLRGRLTAPTVAGPGLGFGGLFKPRPPRQR